MKVHHIALLLLPMMLVGCGSDQGDDLDQFMATAASDAQARIKPLPEVKPFKPIDYNVDGSLSDPFRARKTKNTGGVQPDLKRPKEALESFPLESILYVGTLTKNKQTSALLKTPDNGVQQVKVGNYVGQNFGMVTKVTEAAVIVKEIVQDEMTGDWVERNTELTLQE